MSSVIIAISGHSHLVAVDNNSFIVNPLDRSLVFTIVPIDVSWPPLCSVKVQLSPNPERSRRAPVYPVSFN